MDSPPLHEPRFAAARRVWQPQRLVLLAIVVAGVWLWPHWRKWLPPLADRAEYRLTADVVRITPPPHWVPPNLVDQAFELAGIPSDLSLLDPTATAQIADAFALHPWVKDVVSVQKRFPPAVQIELRYRRPVAMVEVKGGLYPVDDEGILLPPADFSLTAARTFPLVEGILSTPQGPAGTPWGDPMVAEAATIADVLSPAWKQLRLTSIVCPRGATPPGAELPPFTVLAGGSRILWGRSAAAARPGELSAEQKLGRLKKYVHDFGGFDKPHGPYVIDIRHWQEISRRPLPATARLENDDAAF